MPQGEINDILCRIVIVRVTSLLCRNCKVIELTRLTAVLIVKRWEIPRLEPILHTEKLE